MSGMPSRLARRVKGVCDVLGEGELSPAPHLASFPGDDLQSSPLFKATSAQNVPCPRRAGAETFRGAGIPFRTTLLFPLLVPEPPLEEVPSNLTNNKRKGP